MEKDISSNEKKGELARFISDQIDFKQKVVKREKKIIM